MSIGKEENNSDRVVNTSNLSEDRANASIESTLTACNVIRDFFFSRLKAGLELKIKTFGEAEERVSGKAVEEEHVISGKAKNVSGKAYWQKKLRSLLEEGSAGINISSDIKVIYYVNLTNLLHSKLVSFFRFFI